MRSGIVTAFVFVASGCSVLEQIQFGSPGLNPNKIYLDRTTVVSVSARDAHRYACVDVPLICEQRGVTLECRCP